MDRQRPGFACPPELAHHRFIYGFGRDRPLQDCARAGCQWPKYIYAGAAAHRDNEDPDPSDNSTGLDPFDRTRLHGAVRYQDDGLGTAGSLPKHTERID